MTDFYLKQNYRFHNLEKNQINADENYLADEINNNIAHIIDDVKKQRMDIIKLNNDIINSRINVENHNYSENETRDEIFKTIRKLKKEKEMLEMENENLRKSNTINERKMKEKDDIINQLRFNICDYQKNVNDKKNEIEKIKFEYSRLSMKLDEVIESKKNIFSKTQILETLEKQIENYKQKYNQENRKNLELNNQICLLTEKLEQVLNYQNEVHIMINENREKKKNDFFVNGEKIKNNLVEDANVQLKSELVYDYHLLNNFKINLTEAIENLNQNK
jgi:hypothetical protein